MLAALIVESALNRTRYVRSEHQRETAIDTLKRLGAGDLASDIEEVFVLRDIVAHNHVWLATIRWDVDSGMVLDSAEKVASYGDQKFSRVVDPTTRLTHRLRLDAFPNRIHRATAVVALKKAVEVLRFLEGLISGSTSISASRGMWHEANNSFLFTSGWPAYSCLQTCRTPTRTRSSPPPCGGASSHRGRRPRPGLEVIFHVMRLAGGRDGTGHRRMGHDPLEKELRPRLAIDLRRPFG